MLRTFGSRGQRLGIGYQRNQITQNADVNDSDSCTAFVAAQFRIAPADLYDDATAAVHASRFVRDDRELVLKILHASIVPRHKLSGEQKANMLFYSRNGTSPGNRDDSEPRAA